MCANVSRLIYCWAYYSQLPGRAPSTSARTAPGDLPDISHICIAPNSSTATKPFTKEWLLYILQRLEKVWQKWRKCFHTFNTQDYTLLWLARWQQSVVIGLHPSKQNIHCHNWISSPEASSNPQRLQGQKRWRQFYHINFSSSSMIKHWKK